MAFTDNLLFWAIIIISITSLTFSVFAFYKAIKSAKYNDEGLRMFFWAAGGMVGLIITGLGISYILIPIILHYYSTG